jgi:competence protein ComEC
MHKSQIFFWLLVSFLGGVAIRSFFDLPDLLLYMLFAAITCFFFASIVFQRAWFLAGIFMAAALLGIFRYEAKNGLIETSRLPSLYGNQMTLRVLITEEPERNNARMRFVGYTDGDNLLITARPYPPFVYGDLLEVRGRVDEPPSFPDFDYKAYLAKKRITAVMYYPEIHIIAHDQGNALKTKLFALKERLVRSFSAAIPEPHAAFLGGLLVGSRDTIPEDLTEAFRATGTSHLIALSGYNITIIASSVAVFFRLFFSGIFGELMVPALFVILFALMTGAAPSVVRASVLGVLVLLARRAGSPYKIKNALTFAGAAMVWWDPNVLVFDLGFQLSFLATIGLVLWEQPLENRLWWIPKFLHLRASAATTLAAQAAVLPLIWFTFGAISWISPIVNTLILMTIPWAMLFGFLTGIAGFISSSLALIPGWFAYLFLSYELGVISFFATL